MRWCPSSRQSALTPRIGVCALLLCVVAWSCGPIAPTDTAPRATALPPQIHASRGFRPADTALLHQMLPQDGATTFRAFDGRVTGAGYDADVTLLPDGSVHVFECDYGCARSRGVVVVEPPFGIRFRFDSMVTDVAGIARVGPFNDWRFALGWLGGDLVLCRWTVAPSAQGKPAQSDIDCEHDLGPLRRLRGASARKVHECMADPTCDSPYSDRD